MTRNPALAYAPTCYQSKRTSAAASAPTARVTVRFQGVTYVLANPDNESADPCGALVKVAE